MIELLIIALVVFGYTLVSERLSISPVTAPMVFTTVGVFAHGLTAGVWAGRLARRLDAETDPMSEMEPVPELATRSHTSS